jgi:mRNA interferase HigB
LRRTSCAADGKVRGEERAAVHVISIKKLKDFWEVPKNISAEKPLRWWYQQVRAAMWESPADVQTTFNTVDVVGRKTIFDVGGNKYRIIAVIDYEGKVFIRFVLSHKDYDKGQWKKDTFGTTWIKRQKRVEKGGAKPPGGLN